MCEEAQECDERDQKEGYACIEYSQKIALIADSVWFHWSLIFVNVISGLLVLFLEFSPDMSSICHHKPQQSGRHSLTSLIVVQCDLN